MRTRGSGNDGEREREIEEGRGERGSAREGGREREREAMRWRERNTQQRGSSLDLYNEEEINRERRKRERERRLAKENKTPRGWCTRIKNEG